MDYIGRLLSTEITKLSPDQWIAVGVMMFYPFLIGMMFGECRGFDKGCRWARSMRPYTESEKQALRLYDEGIIDRDYIKEL